MFMKKPLIGLVPLVDEEKQSYWMLPGYMKGLAGAGTVPVMLPLSDDQSIISQLADELDGVLFTGGHDVSPELYGVRRSGKCGIPSPERDSMEQKLFNELRKRKKSIFGICRGIQLINVLMGGTLYQDLPSEHPSQTEHHQSPPYDRSVHNVRIYRDSALYGLLGKQTLAVNSYHHQAVKKLADGLLPMAVSEDGLVEAVCAADTQSGFLWAVQWHPEFSYFTDENSRKIFRHFAESCKK